MVAVVRTFGDRLDLHPHVHALVTRHGWTADGDNSAVSISRDAVRVEQTAFDVVPPDGQDDDLA